MFQALSVKPGETPYKMVASYLLNKKLNRDSDTPSLALFGKWQTEPYQPPVATNGKVQEIIKKLVIMYNCCVFSLRAQFYRNKYTDCIYPEGR